MDRCSKLQAYLEVCRDKPFVWGSWDCCQFAAGWVHELTGIDFRSQFPSYADEDEARAILAEVGGLIALTSSLLTEIPVAHAKVGDLVLVNDVAGSALGICLGVQSAHVGMKGLEF